jgi:hypothetical protein
MAQETAMADKQGRGNEAFWKQQLKMAEKRLAAFEVEAQKALGELAERGRRTRAEIEDILRKAGESDLTARAEEIRGQIEKGSAEVVRKLEGLQGRALTALGVANAAQVEELAAKVQKLSRKISKLTREEPGHGPAGSHRAS